MKRTTLLLLFMVSITNNNFAQISTMKVAEKSVEKDVPFDSTKNFLGDKNVYSYIGQELFVMPKAESLQRYGYSDFHSIDYDVETEGSSEKLYGTTKKYEYNSPYESLANKTFIVDDVLPIKKSYLSDKFVFVLSEKGNESNKCKYIYSPMYEHSFPFVTMSYYNYLLNHTKEKKYVIGKNIYHSLDIHTGDSIVNTKDYSFWTVQGLTIEEKYCSLVALLSNGNQTTYCSANDLVKQSVKKRVFEEKEWNDLVKKYGQTWMDLVMAGKIKVGMPVVLVYMSWGSPERINRSSYGSDQWVYDGQYLYIENDKVVSWN